MFHVKHIIRTSFYVPRGTFMSVGTKGNENFGSFVKKLSDLKVNKKLKIQIP